MHFRRFFVVIVAATLYASLPSAVLAQDDGQNNVRPEQVEEIARNLTCSTCGGISVATCESERCTLWRDEIAMLLGEGRPASEIYRYFATTYPNDFSTLLVRGQFGDLYPPAVDPNEVYDIAESMYCDVCAGVALAYCPSSQCRVWREQIGDFLADGKNEEQIRREFARLYGDKVSAVPLDDENRFLTFAVPIGLVTLAGLGVVLYIRRWRYRDSQVQRVARAAGSRTDFDRPVPDNVDEVYLARMLALLEERK